MSRVDSEKQQSKNRIGNDHPEHIFDSTLDILDNHKTREYIINILIRPCDIYPMSKMSRVDSEKQQSKNGIIKVNGEQNIDSTLDILDNYNTRDYIIRNISLIL
eukprot:SAG22_NODE_881_length_6693_cov_15.416288_4_plen_104_part_00